MPPQISIVMPAHDAAATIHRTLAAIQAQKEPPGGFEVVIVDDGSTDGTAAILDSAAHTDARLRVIHQSNSGWPGRPRNVGVDAALGEYVLFVDDDDVLAPTALREMGTAAKRFDADVVVPRMGTEGGRGVAAFNRHLKLGPVEVADVIASLCCLRMIRRSLLLEGDIRFAEGAVRLEDGIFMSQVYAQSDRIVFAGGKPLYIAVRHEASGHISSRRADPFEYMKSVVSIGHNLVGSSDRVEDLIGELVRTKILRRFDSVHWLQSSPGDQRMWAKAAAASLVALGELVKWDFGVAAPVWSQRFTPLQAERIVALVQGNRRRLDRLAKLEQLIKPDFTVHKVSADATGLTLHVSASIGLSGADPAASNRRKLAAVARTLRALATGSGTLGATMGLRSLLGRSTVPGDVAVIVQTDTARPVHSARSVERKKSRPGTRKGDPGFVVRVPLDRIAEQGTCTLFMCALDEMPVGAPVLVRLPATYEGEGCGWRIKVKKSGRAVLARVGESVAA
ncbi:glycosyltransferase family 2 protein [Brevibacterium sp. 91QC2O2]|uniref:glycosyltransferase family 2 protein n=1 Tax=Brevibacterium sp. 91QC2O2 TaxID=2968458 RepID=UPI00211C697D|nr:glycosyltransferase family A protein [Brevibacterium sp. 91QC2O2]MCQ9367840.1 glycosyltransferase family 2 protein [Brevibacterium sp. 91QC2O2]